MKNKLLLLSVLILALSGCATDGGGTTTTAPTSSTSSVQKTTTSTESVAVTCPVECRTMNCPPPNGTTKLCCPRVPYNQTCP
jgi:PBP1b-binding outer membrane lipoprotein LpoB